MILFSVFYYSGSNIIADFCLDNLYKMAQGQKHTDKNWKTGISGILIYPLLYLLSTPDCNCTNVAQRSSCFPPLAFLSFLTQTLYSMYPSLLFFGKIKNNEQ